MTTRSDPEFVERVKAVTMTFMACNMDATGLVDDIVDETAGFTLSTLRDACNAVMYGPPVRPPLGGEILRQCRLVAQDKAMSAAPDLPQLPSSTANDNLERCRALVAKLREANIKKLEAAGNGAASEHERLMLGIKMRREARKLREAGDKPS